jgi:hypothetical protein
MAMHGIIPPRLFFRSHLMNFVRFEQWRDLDALNAHLARLQRVFGLPDKHEPHPPAHHRRRLPKVFLALFEKTEAARYDEIV